MPSKVVVGVQWGDEGKGKIIDILAQEAQVVVRAQGGNNAGHTVEQGSEVYKLRTVPSGILYPDTLCLVGSGVVVNPGSVLAEMDGLEAVSYTHLFAGWPKTVRAPPFVSPAAGPSRRIQSHASTDIKQGPVSYTHLCHRQTSIVFSPAQLSAEQRTFHSAADAASLPQANFDSVLSRSAVSTAQNLSLSGRCRKFAIGNLR